MLGKTLTCLVLLIVLSTVMPSAYAQRAGYQAAIAPSYAQIYSQFPADHQPRAVAIPSAPIVYYGPGYVHSNEGFGGHIYGGTVVVPNTIITNSTLIIQQPVVPAIAVSVAPNVIPARTPAPAVPAVPPAPAPGTSRQQVIQQYGNPVTTMYSAAGETLYFSGGKSVFLQNGKVATPQRPN